MNPTTLQEQAKALGNPTRHAIFRHVARAGRAVSIAELNDQFPFNHNAIRQHLAKLVATGIVVAGDVVADVTAAMARQGFGPEVRASRGGAEIVLHNCPFATSALADRDTICALHLGIAEGLTDTDPATVTELVAYDHPQGRLQAPHPTRPRRPRRPERDTHPAWQGRRPMTDPDEVGEAPCFAHLLDEPPQFTAEALAELTAYSASSTFL